MDRMYIGGMYWERYALDENDNKVFYEIVTEPIDGNLCQFTCRLYDNGYTILGAITPASLENQDEIVHELNNNANPIEDR